MNVKEDFVAFIHSLQDQICKAVEAIDGKEKFLEDRWQRSEGGGGITRIIQNGNVFEKGGVNTSMVHGEVTPAIAKQLNVTGHSFFACGISLVLHPQNPHVPTVHANFRYFELYDEQEKVKDSWFGGGADLTPYYLYAEDATHFHRTFKQSCDGFDTSLYPLYKKQCDDYFANHHRHEERRGLGGIFYDYLKSDTVHSQNFWLDFSKASGNALLPAYLPIVQRRMNEPFTDRHIEWQHIRRGRYVEFNLLHDRGTLFGIKSNGRTESILMSLPPRVRFVYDYHPAKGSEEEKLLHVLQNPVDWI